MIVQAQAAIGMLQQARKFNPYPPSYYWESLAIAQLTLGLYQESITSLQLMMRTYWWDYCYLAACYSGLGDLDAGKKFISKTKELRPGINLQELMSAEPFKMERDSKAFSELLLRVGMPEK